MDTLKRSLSFLDKSNPHLDRGTGALTSDKNLRAAGVYALIAIAERLDTLIARSGKASGWLDAEKIKGHLPPS